MVVIFLHYRRDSVAEICFATKRRLHEIDDGIKTGDKYTLYFTGLQPAVRQLVLFGQRQHFKIMYVLKKLNNNLGY